MEIKNSNKFKSFFKRYGALACACVFSLALALTLTFALSKDKEQPVNTDVMKFSLPMSDAVVVKDYSEDKLQFNESLNRWEIHLALDLSSENSAVFSICDGTVSSVESNSLDGYVVTIQHSDGIVSVYSSLADDIKVSVGDVVTGGQQIGSAAATATNESKSGGHLHLTMYKNGVEIDPNNYLDLQNK